MGRRPKNDDYPKARQHKGQARLRILDEEYYCGPWGSPESRAEQDRLIAEWIASGRTVPPKKRPRVDRKATTGFQNPDRNQAPRPAPSVASGPYNGDVAVPEPPAPDVPLVPLHVQSPHYGAIETAEYATGFTVGDIANLWLDWIEQTQCPRGKSRTSLYYGARQAIRALEDFWEFPAASFGCPELTEVQQRLLRTPVVSRPTKPGKKPKSRPRFRTTINDTVGRIRQLFKWAASRRLIPREVWPVIKEDLRLVQPLLRGKCDAPDGPYDRTVDDALVDAILPALPDVVADLLRFQRLTGCRPGEARCLQLADIDRRPLPTYKGTWVWQVPDWKLSWRERHIPRLIAIGPKAQAVLQKWIDRLDGDVGRTIFSPRFSQRDPTRWCRRSNEEPQQPRRRKPRKPRKTTETYSPGAINTCVRRACDKLEQRRWTTNQLRHNRLTQIREYQSLEESQAVGGHSRVNQTQHYAHVLLGKAIEAAQTG